MEQLHGTWGNRLKTFQWDGGLITLLWLEPNKRCSWHSHKHNWNQFTCISGMVGIKTDKGFTTILTEKQAFTIEPGVYHEFQTYKTGAIIEEITYVKYNENDIERKNLGGTLDEPKISKDT